MKAFLISLGTVTIAEMGDRTQLLTMMLAARFRKPWPILAGILTATILNHAAAGVVGSLFGAFLTPVVLNGVVGASMIAMALWMLKPDQMDSLPADPGHTGIFTVTFVTFFFAEIGDKTQIATVALAAAYPNLAVVIAGTTLGMMLANTPVVFFGNAFASRLPVKALNYGAAILFAIIGIMFVASAVGHQGTPPVLVR
ncbi:MAG: TMEM165/GDT1 family protein [Rhodospirillaceae bacterium]|nr:MAG: TMEM165/GDT1 family protein [Rhodospirillaceae bacterium]